MAKKKILKENGKEILPITHEKCVLDNNGVSLAEKIGNMDDLMADSDDLVSAINEVTNFNNNFKGLIADSIGSPISADDSFNDIRNDINSLLSQFKTNMMNAGVVVESGDKFESLIEKIKGLTEGEGNKGIQFAEGTSTMSNGVNCYYPSHFTTAPNRSEAELEINLDFNPSYIFCKLKSFTFKNLSNNLTEGASSLSTGVYVSNTISPICYTSSYATKIGLELVDNSKFKLYAEAAKGFQASITTDTYVEWYAIGVGEEDTTLRDSLADILENKGVEVSPDDDLADLIGKVDSINSGGLDIISATELPATGRENQICVITDNPVNDFVITSNYSDINTNTNNTIYIFLGNSLDTTGIKGTNFDLVSNNITMKYYLLSVHQGGNKLDSYIFKNNQWTDATMSSFYIVEKGNSVNESYTGGFTGDWGVGDLNGTPCYVANIPSNINAGGGTMCFDNYTVNKINVSDYTTLEYTIASSMPEYSFGGEVYMLINTTRNTTIYIDEVYKYWKTSQPGSFTTYTIDISDITGEYYLGIAYIGYGCGQKLCVSDIRLY